MVAVVVIREAPSPEEIHEVVLTSYSVFETGDERVFVGFVADEGCWCVSTGIAEWDVDALAGRTRSGRRYLLSGEPCVDGTTRALALARCGVDGLRDVTGEYVPSAS